MGATQLTMGFNEGLRGALMAYVLPRPGIRVTRLDAFALLNGIVANPASFGLTTVTTSCVNASAQPYACPNVGDYLFWDGIHPTKAGHAIIAEEPPGCCNRARDHKRKRRP